MACADCANGADCGAAAATIGAGAFDCKGTDGAGVVTAGVGAVGKGGGTPSFGAGCVLARFDAVEVAGVALPVTPPGLCCFNKTPPMAMTATANTAIAAHSARGPRCGVESDATAAVEFSGEGFSSEFMAPI